MTITQIWVSDGRRLTRLAAPIAGTQLAQIAVSTASIALLGTLGVNQLAAGGLALVLFNQIRTMCVGLITASGNQIAAATDPDEVRDVVRAGVLVATAAGVLGGVVLVGLGWALRWLGQDATVLAAARPMLIALAPGLLPCLWFQALRQFSVGMQRSLTLLAVTVGSVVLYLPLAWILMRRFGIAGIGVATTVTFVVSCVMFAVMVRRDPVLGPALPRNWLPVRKHVVARELRLGTPIALTYGSEAGLFSVLALVMGHLGPAALAAHNAVYQLVYIVFQVAIGLSQGASILVSKAIATGDIGHAHRLARTALGQSAAVVAAVGVTYLVIPNQVLRLFLDQPLPLARTLLLIAIGLQFVDAAQNIAVGLLRGLRDTAAAFRLSVIGYWVVGLPTALVLAFPARLGPVGVWLGLTAGLAASATLMLRRYYAELPGLQG